MGAYKARMSRVASRIACAAGIASALGIGPPPAHAAPLAHLDGEVRAVAPPALFSKPGNVVGSFTLDGWEGGDLRTAPGQILVAAPDSLLIAIGATPTHLYGAWRFDPASGRPLRADAATDGACPTGAEPDCWQPGDAIPGDRAAADALCALRSPGGGCSIPPPQSPSVSGSLSPPAVPITTDPQDGGDGATDGGDTSPDALSAAQQALIGCGPFWGTDCASDGVDLLDAEESVVLQSFVFLPPPSPAPVPPPPLPLPVPNCSPDDASCKAAELAALSHNFQILVAALSQSPPPGDVLEWDGDPSTFDFHHPFSTAPGQCSWSQPQFCASVQSLLGLATTPLQDDPNGGSLGRWVWESGAEYTVAVATGAFDGFAGGVLHLADPELSRAAGGRIGVPIVLMPPGGAAPAPEPLLLYAVVPEPETSALGAAAIAALALGCARRRARVTGSDTRTA